LVKGLGYLGNLNLSSGAVFAFIDGLRHAREAIRCKIQLLGLRGPFSRTRIKAL
jgi:hypothetical protein